MCVNFRSPSIAQIMALKFSAPPFDFAEESYPKDASPILVWANDQWEWRRARFGLLPGWSDSSDYAAETYNARSETVATKASFRNAWGNNQFALVPMQAFYEPRYGTSPQSERWRIEHNDQVLFMAAAIYDVWHDPETTIHSFSLLTINADQHPLMQQFHRPEVEKRSIVVMPRPLWKQWLRADHRHAQTMLRDLDAKTFRAYADARPVKKITSANLDLF
jgi:putative SOS response-associated peptidase YedK